MGNKIITEVKILVFVFVLYFCNLIFIH